MTAIWPPSTPHVCWACAGAGYCSTARCAAASRRRTCAPSMPWTCTSSRTPATVCPRPCPCGPVALNTGRTLRMMPDFLPPAAAPCRLGAFVRACGGAVSGPLPALLLRAARPRAGTGGQPGRDPAAGTARTADHRPVRRVQRDIAGPGRSRGPFVARTAADAAIPGLQDLPAVGTHMRPNAETGGGPAS